MGKKISGFIKLQIPAGQATPGPPVGPALGQHGVNIVQFTKAFNSATSTLEPGLITPVVITVFADRTFSFETKSPPTSVLLLKALKKPKGSPEPNKMKIGRVSNDQVREIAKIKIPDLNTDDIDMAMRIVKGTARSMGIETEA
jgi:large subunit ribosomal protein L11